MRARLAPGSGKQATMRSSPALRTLCRTRMQQWAACEVLRFPELACGPNEVGRSSSRVDLVAYGGPNELARHHLVCRRAWTNESGDLAALSVQGDCPDSRCLDWIANEARLRLAVFVEKERRPTSWMGRRARYALAGKEKTKDYDLRCTYSASTRSLSPTIPLSRFADSRASAWWKQPSHRAFLAYNA